MRSLLSLLAATLVSALSLTAAPLSLALWPHGAPDDPPGLGPEQDTTKPTDGLVAGRRVIRLGNVTGPTLTVYRPAPDRDSGATVLVCPGGAYQILAMDLEGTEVAEWLNRLGITGVVLKYRVPPRPNRPRYAAALQDAQRALGLLRFHAAVWGLDPKHLGVLGCSAGGHLAAALSCNYAQRTYAPQDPADAVSCRPDFTLLIYPAYLTRKAEGDALAPELAVTSDTPPTFLVQAEDDGVRVETSLFYYLALRKARVPAEMHLYPSGGHGYGLRSSPEAVTTWPARAEEWFRTLGVLRPGAAQPRRRSNPRLMKPD